jgi:hypothetical protein
MDYIGSFLWCYYSTRPHSSTLQSVRITGTPGPSTCKSPAPGDAEFASTGAFIVVDSTNQSQWSKTMQLSLFQNIPCSYTSLFANSTAMVFLGLGESDCNVQVNFELRWLSSIPCSCIERYLSSQDNQLLSWGETSQGTTFVQTLDRLLSDAGKFTWFHL